MFEFQIVVTEKCNLCCTYCYMRKKPQDMTKKVFDSHFAFLPDILRLYNQNQYNATFFGGEPLLNWELIEYITQKLVSDYKCNKKIIVTNGLGLNNKKIEFLTNNNIGISLSFDGLWNNENRPYSDNRPSIQKYIEKKHLLSQFRGCKVMIHPGVVSTMVDNYKFFVEEYAIPFPDFTLVRDDVWEESQISTFNDQCHLLAEQTIKYLQAGIETFPGIFKLYISDLIYGNAYGKRPFGCFAGCSGAGFMPDGLVYPCARYGTNMEFPLGNSTIKDIYTRNVTYFKNPKISNPQTFTKCKKCELYNYCNAGCTYQQSLGKTYSEPVDSICQLLKICYRESIWIAKELKDNLIFQNIIKSSLKGETCG